MRAAPSQPVVEADLGPPPAATEPETPVAGEPLPGEGAQSEADVAALPAEEERVAINRTDLVGGWSVASGGTTCQLFMSLTTWTGGYRASTRGCSDPTLAGISAWDVSGSTVTLKAGDPATDVASLAATDGQRFSGATTDGTPITVAR